MKRFWFYFIFISIFLSGGFLRLWKLGQIPEGFYSDEALYGYEAFSLSQTGKDQFGNPHPISIAGFGDYRPAFYIYATIPFIKYLGLNEFATRLPSTISSIATLGLVYLFTCYIIKNRKIGLFAMLLFAFSPWSIFFGRMAHETNLQTLLILVGAIFIELSRKRKGYIFLALLSLLLAMYTYHSARVFVPLFLVFSLFLYRKDFFKSKLLLIAGLVFFLLLLSPLILEFRGDAGWSRVNGIGFWNDPGVTLRINETRGNFTSWGVSQFISRMIVNKITVYPQIFVKNYLAIFSPNFLIFKGDSNGIYNTPSNGILLWIQPLLIIIGLIFLWKKQRALFWWILAIIFLSFVPDALTRVGPSSARIHLALPFISVISGIGLYVLARKSKLAFWVFVIMISLNYLWFWHNYLSVRPIVFERDWQLGTKQMIQKATQYEKDFDQIWISRTGWGWIHLLFHSHYDAAAFQKEARHSEKNELGFWWINQVGKYHLDWFPEPFVMQPNTLYIGNPNEFPAITSPLEIIYYPDGKPVYYLVGKPKSSN